MTWMTNGNFLSRTMSGFVAALANANRLVVYKGTIPSTATGFTEAGYSTSELCRFTGFVMAWNNNNTGYFSSNPSPSDVTATGTGTATWFALWPTGGPSIVMIGDVSTNGGTGALYLSTVNIISGNTVSYLNFSFTFTGV